MNSKRLEEVIDIINSYVVQNYSIKELKVIVPELIKIEPSFKNNHCSTKEIYSYEKVQKILSTLNEKESIRKNKGVYYTPQDIVKFILTNSIKNACGKLKSNNFHVMDLNGVSYQSFCYKKSVFDPTCGAGVFLLAALEIKLDLLDLHHNTVTKVNINNVISSLYGNDINIESITISKLRMFICVLNRYGVDKIKDLADILNENFFHYDFASTIHDSELKFDIIIGNPPYVEDSKSESMVKIKYGNIYANVLENASKRLQTGGVMGFIIPLSYVATPRMSKIRSVLFENISKQYILSYSDRPDCLFAGVHQKLCILFGENKVTNKEVYTSNYKYWYKEERENLFHVVEVIKNNYYSEKFIPKIGNQTEAKIYGKVKNHTQSMLEILSSGQVPIYLNMRATFWIKAFLNEHKSAEYKMFFVDHEEKKHLCMCLLNSSLFWWFWITTSDCWHITNKELLEFNVPNITDYATVNNLAIKLEEKLENTKVYVGTKQTEYEYKHKLSADVINEIDDYINQMYGLTEEENLYIKNFAYRYRIGGGAVK